MGLFDSKLKKVSYNTAVDSSINTALANAETEYGKNIADSDAYSAAVKAMQSTVNKIGTEGVDMLGTAARRTLSYNPIADYERIRTGNLNAFNQQAKNMAGYKGLADKLAFAARGYVPGGRGSYEDILTTNRIASNLSPVLSGIFSNLGRDTSVIGAGRSGQMGDLMQLLSERQQYPVNAVNFGTMPIGLRNLITQASTDNLGQMGGIAKNNVAGFREEASTWDTIIKAMNDVKEVSGLNDIKDVVITALGGQADSGGGGGGGGYGGQTTQGVDMQAMMNAYRQSLSPSRTQLNGYAGFADGGAPYYAGSLGGSGGSVGFGSGGGYRPQEVF